MIFLFRVPGTGLSRHASDIKEKYEVQSIYKDKGKWWGNYQVNDLVVSNDFKGSGYQLPQRLKLASSIAFLTWWSQEGYMNFTSHITVIIRNYDCYMLYGKVRENIGSTYNRVGVISWSNCWRIWLWKGWKVHRTKYRWFKCCHSTF